MTEPSTARLVVAGWELTLLDLGALYAPLSWVFPDAPESELAWLPFGALLCRRGGDVVLVDCGVGPFGDVYESDVRTVPVADALAAAGCSPQDVSLVVLTHLDPDHAGGIVRPAAGGGLEPSLTDAAVVMLDTAYETLVGRGAVRTTTAETIHATLVRAGVRMAAVADGGEISAGSPITLRSAPGHRVGHACVEIEGAGERFVFLADALHAREHVPHPAWDVAVDSDPETALSTRRALIDEHAGSGVPVACSHVAGFGRIEHDDDGAAVWVDVA